MHASLWRKHAVSLLLICTGLMPIGVSANDSLTQFQLENGLNVIIQVDRRAPVAVVQTWYGVGGGDEPEGMTGVSHVLEHMMFKGTEKVPVGEFSRIVARFGGSDNAYTTQSETVYFQRVLSHRVQLALELEADRMTGLLLDKQEFKRELQVVIEERRQRTDDRPGGRAFELFNATAHVENPQRTPVIGWRHDLEKLTIEQVRQWYAQWYAPNNATLVVVGDVDPDQVRHWVADYFALIPARTLPERPLWRETATLQERQQTLTLPAQVPSLYLGFNWPSLQTAKSPEEAYGLRMLAGILDGGVSARLESNLVRTGKAAAVNSSYNLLSRGDTLLVITAVPVPGQNLTGLREQVLAEVMRLRDEVVDEDEIERVLVNVLSDSVFSRDSLDQQASQLGQLATLNLPLDWPTQYAQALRQITPEQIQALAKQYLQPERMTTLYMQIDKEKTP
ncbi:MAG: pitrilysin family protein [Moraxellaceae bacterium]|nr:pitrilysin family protein [Moraxellaceae bacterium]